MIWKTSKQNPNMSYYIINGSVFCTFLRITMYYQYESKMKGGKHNYYEAQNSSTS